MQVQNYMLFLVCLATWLLQIHAQDDSDLREPFIRYGPEDIDVFKGEKILLQCYVYGKPLPTVTWYKNGVNLPENEEEGRVIDLDQSLVIRKARRNSKHDDSGVYACKAKNTKGEQWSKNATVNVKFLSKTFIENPRNATVKIHSDHVMRCQAPQGYPNPVISWLKDGQPLKQSTFVKVSGSNGSSQISFKQLEWASRGVYKCQAKSDVGTRLSEPAYLTLQEITPQLYPTTKIVDVYVGESISLQCSNSFLPEPKRNWSKTSGNLPANRVKYHPFKTIMTITEVEISDSGAYKCLARNDAGEDSLQYHVIVYEKMYFIVAPTSVTIGKGQTATFRCQVGGGKKKTTVLWHYGRLYHNTETTGRIRMTPDNSLVVENVSAEDIEKVECVGEDKKERKYSNKVDLNILDITDPPPSITSLKTMEQVEGSKVVLPCSATGKGTLKFQWLTAKDNNPVNVGADGVWITQSTGTANLTLNKVLVSDSGGYRCKVTGTTGSSSAVTMVSIKPSDGDKPPKVTNVRVLNVGPTSLTLKWSRPNTGILSPVTSYVISISSQRNSWETTVEKGETTQKEITNLAPGTLYSFSIVAVNKNGRGEKTDFPDTDTLPSEGTTDLNRVVDKLENISLVITIPTRTTNTILIRWNPVDASRITGYSVFYWKAGELNSLMERKLPVTATNYVLRNLKEDTRYEIEMKAFNRNHQSKLSERVSASTEKRIIIEVQNVRVTKHKEDTITVAWKFSSDINQAKGILYVKVVLMTSNPREISQEKNVTLNKGALEIKIFSSLNPKQRYFASVVIVTQSRVKKKSKEVSFRLADMATNEVISTSVPTNPNESKEKTENNEFLALVKEPWFIGTVGALIGLVLLIIIILIVCKRRKRYTYREPGLYESRGLIPTGTRGMDYPNTSLNRSRMFVADNRHQVKTPAKRKLCSCCRASRASSVDEDFPNRADIKPFTGYFRQDNMEMRMKAAGAMDSLMKENNLGVAMRNGFKIDTPLNNEIGGYRQNSIDNRMYNGPDRSRMMPHPGTGYRDHNVQPHPGSGSMPRRNENRTKQDSVDRRHGEIIRTGKQVPEDDVNVMDGSNQASWKREPKMKDPTTTSAAPVKPPGENTLRRQGKTQFKPLPNLEVLKWADGLPNTSQAPSINGSPPGSPKTTASASVLSEADQLRPDSRLESHGGSSNSLNKYSYEKRRRRNSNASSMMSSELYQSEMDPSGYSDITSERKKRKEKAIPPPIDFDGLTSDILLQWAESVTNSSPSSSGSSSPSRLSEISSEGSLYTDEDFAQAVAAVAECGGFNMDYDYNLPGMNIAQAPLSSTRNSKMDKIDQMFAQRSKQRTPGVSKPGSRHDTSTPQGHIPQISMSSYITSSQKGPQSTHSSSNGAPSRSSRYRGEKNQGGARYGTGFDDVDTVSTTSATKPLTMSNLMKHDNSLDREKKESAKPLTVSNLRQHESSLDRERRPKHHQPKPQSGYNIPPSYESIEQNGFRDSITRSNPMLPEAALSVTSALERNESMNSNSKDSLNSSNRHDSEIENNNGTSERRQQRRTKKHRDNFDPKSSTSTVNTVRTSQGNESDF